MSILAIGEPGSEYGPCKEKCKHPECEGSRKRARKKCYKCGKLIGYNRQFWILTDNKYEHVSCWRIKSK